MFAAGTCLWVGKKYCGKDEKRKVIYFLKCPAIFLSFHLKINESLMEFGVEFIFKLFTTKAVLFVVEFQLWFLRA